MTPKPHRVVVAAGVQRQPRPPRMIAAEPDRASGPAGRSCRNPAGWARYRRPALWPAPSPRRPCQPRPRSEPGRRTEAQGWGVAWHRWASKAEGPMGERSSGHVRGIESPDRRKCHMGGGQRRAGGMTQGHGRSMTTPNADSRRWTTIVRGREEMSRVYMMLSRTGGIRGRALEVCTGEGSGGLTDG